MNRALFSENEKGRFYVQFNIDGLMRGDYKSRMEGYAIARQNGWMSANDIRALENMNPIPDEEGGNTYLCNGNLVPVGLAGITMLTSAMSTLTEPAPEENPPEETPEPEPPKTNKRARRNAH